MFARSPADDAAANAALIDAQLWHADFEKIPPRRARSLLRQNSQPKRPVVPGPQQLLRKGDSRLLTARYAGQGGEAFTVTVPRGDWDEEAVGLSPSDARKPVVIKLGTVLIHRDQADSRHRRVVVREIVQGFFARKLQLPFVATPRDWGLCGVEQGNPSHVSVYRIGSDLRRKCKDVDAPVEPTDFVSEMVANQIRYELLRSRKLLAEKQRDNLVVRSAYLRERQHELNRYRQLPIVVLEQEYAGPKALDKLIDEHNLLLAADSHWYLVRNLFYVLVQAIEQNQRLYGWQHGDASLSNVVLSEWTGDRSLPQRFHNIVVPQSGNKQRPIVPADLRVALNGVSYVPWFVDLSRSAINLEKAGELLPACDQRSMTFHHDAVDYMDGYSSRLPAYGGRLDMYARTLDIRRLGMGLAYLIVRQVSAKVLHVNSLDARMVRLATVMIQPAASWFAVQDFGKLRGDSLVMSESWSEFCRRSLWLWHYMICLESFAAAPFEQFYTPPKPANAAEIVADHARFFEEWNKVHHDLNSYLGWALSRNPTLEQNDNRLPERVLLWDAFFV